MISKAKDKRQNPELFSRHAGKSGDYRMDRIAQLYAEYEKRLHEANALDFDDIILKTVELLEQFEDVRTYYQRKFHYVMIDEYQDTNQLQYQLTALLAGGYENICVVGDDDQSIYKFRGATIENILSFEKQFKGARVIRLEQNYRSTQAILNAANAVISHNRGRKGKKLWTQNAAGDRITVYEASSESDEANYIASRIISMSKGRNFKDFAVLYRTNAQSNAVENAFKRSGIPYRIIGGTRFFDRAEVKDMLAYLCVINNRADELRLQRIINNPPRGIGRMCHIAFWEPHFADEYETEEAWLAEPCRIGARLHPFTIEQNAITSFRSSWPLIPCYANTIGPKIIFGSDYAIGGADGVLSRGMQWQGMSFWMTLRYGPTKAVTSSRIPTMPGKLFFMQELAGPLCADTN